MNIIDPSGHPAAHVPAQPQQPADLLAAAGFPPAPAEQYSAPPIVGPQFPPTPNPAPGPAAVAPPSVLDILAQAGVDPNLLAQAQAIANAQAPAPAPVPQPAPQPFQMPQMAPQAAPAPQVAPQAPQMAPQPFVGVQSFPVAQAAPGQAELVHGPVIGFVSASETCVGGTIHADGTLVRTDGVKDSDWQNPVGSPALDETGRMAGAPVASAPPGFNL